MSISFNDLITQEAEKYREEILEVRKVSNYYPTITKTERHDRIMFSTFVRIKRNDKWYKVHLVHNAYKDARYNFEASTLNLMREEAHKIYHLFHLVEYDGNIQFCELDECQLEEDERLKLLYEE